MSGDVETFIARWQGREGGQERANYVLFLSELCSVLDLPAPDPAGASTVSNDYVFERAVRETGRDGSASMRRIDLYKRDGFVLEAKQSRFFGDKKLDDAPAAGEDAGRRGRRGAHRGWDALMLNARIQAESYVRLLPADHEPPPFVLVCDVGHCVEVYANFRRDGKAYDQFPDRRSFRIYLEELRDPAVRERLRAIWTQPMGLDPSRHRAEVTRDIAARLAKVSKTLETDGHSAEDVAMFLMRLLFTMFAGDVELLPKDAFPALLRECERDPAIFPGMLEDLWTAMDKGTFTASIKHRVKCFNGEFFKDRTALPLSRKAIGELVAAADRNWRDVEPAIFGTLLEQALEPSERRRLGAHYTPGRYVERLVVATVVDPLRAEWAEVLSTAERQKSAGRSRDAIATVQSFHDKLCETRVLDPACGTGNFLYIALLLMKKLEDEVLEAVVDLGGQEALTGLAGHSVDPHQFLGLELNPRAAAIAELVLWIGHLQWHMRSKGGIPGEPILRAFRNIEARDAVLTFDGDPEVETTRGRGVYPNPTRPAWPEADFIVGNPPFIGGKDLRARLTPEKAEALWAAHPRMNESADFVMYWWDRAAEILLRKGSRLRRFGFVTTNSISQVFQRRVMERHLQAKRPLSIVMAIPDHPWTKQARDSAAVRIAMTVAEAGKTEGVLSQVIAEEAIDTDAPIIGLRDVVGPINSDLTVGVDVTKALRLRANEGICSPGVKLHGTGFIVSRKEANALGLRRHPGLRHHIRDYRNGRDLTGRPRGVMVIDLFGLQIDDVRQRFPEVYQHVRLEVKEKIDATKGKPRRVGRDWNNRAAYRDLWWIFGEPRPELRPALETLPRYLATVETAKHRVFQFLDRSIVPDNMIVAVASDDGFALGVLSSRIHARWALSQGGTLEDRPRYSKSRCFDPFPFPETSEHQKAVVRTIAEALDAHRKRVLAEHPHLSLTGLYNVLERLRGGAAASALSPQQRRIFDDGLVLILKELHDRLDAAVAEAYGWPADLATDALLARLVALNRERTREETRGLVRWVRPDYQIPRFGTATEKARQLEADLGGAAASFVAGPKAAFPKNELEQTVVVMAALASAGGPLDAAGIAARFKPARNVRAAVGDVLLALRRMGQASTGDGRRFALKRAA